MHYYQHHIGDFIRDTSRLSDDQCMAYLRMIWLYYESEQPLPNNPRLIAFRVGSSEDVVSLILESFFRLEDDDWKHTRCESEMAEYKAICERNRLNGKSGGRPKKTQSVSSGFPVGTQSEPIRNPNHKPVTSNQEPNNPPPTPQKGEEPAKPSRKFDPNKACPENVTPEVWADWVKFRKELRKPLTETSCERQAKELAGHSSPDQVILASISAGWQGLFPDRISNVTPIRGGKPSRPALKPGEFYDLEWDDKNPATHKIYHTDTHDPTTGYAWVWLKKQTWYRP